MTVPNFTDKTIWTGDNLDILRGMNSECVDLIYLEPPFNSNQNYIPHSRGGTDHIENLQLLCPNCNRIKGDRPQEHLIARLSAMSLAS